jgi:acetyltransferase-like isoleucine patch superfamily enzyme
MRNKLFKLKNSLIQLIIRLKHPLAHDLYLGKNIIFRGLPIIEIRNGGKISLGDAIKIDSKNKGYHINMHSPVKLSSDRQGSILEIMEETCIHGSCIHAHNYIKIGKRCLIAANCQIFDDSGHDLSFSNVKERRYSKGIPKTVIIEDDVWVGANCIILPGSKIGTGTIISAGSVVYGEIPPGVIIAGNPAKIVRAAD